MEAVTTSSRGDKRMVRFSNRQEQEYDLVVGAAGVNSPLRAAVFGPSAARQIDIETETYMYADCRSDKFSDGSVKVMKLFSGFRGPLAGSSCKTMGS
ncbi:hypothetical protein [Sinorhizobium chiapasense]|uniref:Uncharacterized protein n=1 Tax=Sinorhizobium chiapasense TaxID=501572 RepID=A0ABZ2BHF7_9HYPH